MAAYFILYFQAPSLDKAVLEKWLLEEDTECGPQQPLFSYKNGDREEKFCPPIPGIFKVHLYKEGHPLKEGAEVAVLSLDENEAERAAEKGLGKLSNLKSWTRPSPMLKPPASACPRTNLRY